MTKGAPIRIEALSKHYETSAGVVRAVDGVTIEIEPGTSLAVTGPSGCGKSTLLGLMAGLESPSAGSVSLGGHEISSLPERDRERIRRDEVGLVFQADNLLPFLTALENVELQLALNGSASRWIRLPSCWSGSALASTQASSRISFRAGSGSALRLRGR